MTPPAPGFDPARDRYLVVCGRGRSGTNLVLDILDAFADTVCRNEPNVVRGSALAALPADVMGRNIDAGFVDAWREALRRAAGLKSSRDRIGAAHKAHYVSPLHAALAERVLSRGRVRRALSPVAPGMAGEEWSPPAWLLRRDALARALPVFKILRQPHWLLRTHAEDPGQHVVHVVRPAVGFIRSWFNRYVALAPGGERGVFDQNMKTARPIVAHFGARFLSGDAFSRDALIESELWRWRYVNEKLMAGLGASARYRMVGYREASGDPVALAGGLAPWLGLDFDDAVRRRLARTENTLFARPHSETLDPALIERLARHVVADGPLSDLVA